jgi:hypothetical protein
MKIRNGFVSNSSSTSFAIIFKKDILNNLRDTVKTYLKKEFGYLDDEDKIVDKIYSEIEIAISSGKEIYQDNFYGKEGYLKELDARVYDVISDFAVAYGLVVCKFDTSSDGGGIKILNVNDYENIRKFMEE